MDAEGQPKRDARDALEALRFLGHTEFRPGQQAAVTRMVKGDRCLLYCAGTSEGKVSWEST